MNTTYVSYLHTLHSNEVCLATVDSFSWSTLKQRISYNFKPVWIDATEYLTGLNVRYPAHCQVHVLALCKVI